MRMTSLTFRSIQRWYSDNEYRQPFLDNVEGALTKELLVCDKDVQVIYGFDSMEYAKAYLDTDIFKNDVIAGLQPTWSADPDIRYYTVAG